ncbi:unnamed protein product [Staurois parvus]|uniref:Uncharacterized protein n=1 Tax=Staurois parvus TaxID=386267 RepID=A0ABN9E028_9NEOB|nr:unnamed protein product [Staurois parvus]
MCKISKFSPSLMCANEAAVMGTEEALMGTDMWH